MTRKTKKVGDLDLNLKKLPCDQTFDVKQASGGIFIEGFANKATVDRGDEMIATDAWELDNFKRNPIILFNHGMDTLGGTPVGKATEVRQTDEGLFLKVKMSNSQAPGIKMVRELVEERILKAFSVGFNPKQTDTVDIDGKSVRRISKAELFEVSIVGVPMNQDSLFELSEKSLTTKSLHQLKGEILKAKKADAASRVEELLSKAVSRKDVIALVAKSAKVDMNELLDMLAGDKELPKKVEDLFPAAIKQADLKQTLEEALSALNEGAEEEAVLSELRSKLDGETTDEEDGSEEPDPKDPAESGESEEAGKDKTDGATSATEEEDGGEEAETTSGDGDAGSEDPKRKADFQECVNTEVPKLIAGGMAQDEAVAAAMAKCQESGKCTLTPQSKLQVFKQIVEVLDADLNLAAIDLSKAIAFQKQVGEDVQDNQAPTTPVKTEDNPENFGSPFLEAAKQTNVLLGALISEMQGLRKEIAGLSTSNTAASEEDPSKGSGTSTDDGKKPAAEDEAAKALKALNLRLKNLGF